MRGAWRTFIPMYIGTPHLHLEPRPRRCAPPQRPGPGTTQHDRPASAKASAGRPDDAPCEARGAKQDPSSEALAKEDPSSEASAKEDERLHARGHGRPARRR